MAETAGDIIRAWRKEKNPTVSSLKSRAEAAAAPAPSSGGSSGGFSSGGGGGGGGSSQPSFTPQETAMSTAQGYVLSTGEVTQDRARAEADAAKISTGVVSASRGSRSSAFSAPTSGGQSTPEGYVLSTGEVTQDRARAEADVRKAIVKAQRTPQALAQPEPEKIGFKKTPGGMISADTSRGNIFKRAGKAFLAGFTFEKDAAPQYVKGRGTFAVGKPGIDLEEAGYVTGTTLGIAAAGSIGKGAEFVGPKIGAAKAALKSSKAGKALQAIRGTRAGRIATDIPGAVLTTEVIGEATEAGVRKVKLTQEEKEAIKASDNFGKSVTKAFEAEQSAIRSEAWYKAIAFEVSPAIVQKKEVFMETAKAEFQAQGFTGDRLQAALSAASKERSARTIGEGAKLLTISAISESIGQREVKASFAAAKKAGTKIPSKRAFSGLFKTTFPGIAQAGFVEGAVGEFAQQRSRRDTRPVKPSIEKPADLLSGTKRGRALDVALVGAGGAVSAGVIGGTIAGTRVTRPGVSKVIEYGAYFTDPYEKPGDLLSEGIEVVGHKIARTPRTVPVITQTLAPTDMLSLSTKPTGAKPKGRARAAPRVSPVSELSFSVGVPAKTPTKTQVVKAKAKTGVKVPTMVKTPVPADIPTSIEDIVLGTPSETPSQVPIPVPTDVPVPVPTDVPTPTPTETPTDIITNINVPTNIPTMIPTNIPTLTPLFRIPPPLPLPMGLDAGGAGGGSRAVKGKTFINELQEGRKLLDSLLGSGIPARQPTPKRGKKSKGKAGKPFNPIELILG